MSNKFCFPLSGYRLIDFSLCFGVQNWRFNGTLTVSFIFRLLFMNIENIETHNIVFIRLPTKANMKKKKRSPVQYGVLYNFEIVYAFRNDLVPLVLAAGVKTRLWPYHVSAIGRYCLGNGYPGIRLIIIGFRPWMVRILWEVQWKYKEEKFWAQ